MDTARTVNPDHTALTDDLKRDGVEFAIGAFIDITGRCKSKIVPINELPRMLAGSERYTPRGLGDLGVMTPDEDEVVALPDPGTMRRVSWDRRFVWFAADMSYGGREPFALCPRSILKKQLAIAADRGYRFNLGVEPEFYVFRDDPRSADGYLEPMTRSEKLRPTSAYDVEAALDSMPFLAAMVEHMNDAGFEVFSFDSEGGDGQYEIDFEYREALVMCDQLSYFKVMARQVAKQHGLEVTFMPKPYTESWGSGAHFNMSLEDLSTGENSFFARQADGSDPWTKTSRQFAAGILRHARAIAAIATPTVNSYKRLTERLSDGTVSWAPVWITYGHNNRSCMLRFPGNRPCIENRAVDIATNPYLAAAFLLRAGLEGIEHGYDPGEPMESNAYLVAGGGMPQLPRTLLEAVEAFQDDELAAEVFPKKFIDEYVAKCETDWHSYHATVSDWEREKYLYNL
ncbi:MAG: glutamine synthetase [Acidimicrobiaceae bacterium]|jgi:glutamine synthetase|nr:glutamine synthetase [Acidimicrobiaceae bacterium]MDQ1370251.1 glutamine synthetase [Acidimicrobiaceae bacterium]MDQ1378159.1 glutamine synthetase [Acidimicrobiaceae bacterium]MDQ1401284.1 glutamine synthetase [Acidimicrobiaceae bacterium]MDQ1416341.1 glutamine synthetase [Acidimicrobiaceae bacterium]